MKLVAVVAVAVGACAGNGTPPPARPAPAQPPGHQGQATAAAEPARHVLVDPGAEQPRVVQDAIAVLHPTAGNHVAGQIRFRQVEGGLEVFATIENLPPDVHAYHVHVYGDCSAPDGTSAGPHFHFTGSSLDTEVPIITGNLGEIRDGRPTATHRARIPEASLQGKYSIIGRSVIVHAQGNDPSVTPDGGAGARLACGVIGVANPTPQRAASR